MTRFWWLIPPAVLLLMGALLLLVYRVDPAASAGEPQAPCRCPGTGPVPW